MSEESSLESFYTNRITTLEDQIRVDRKTSRRYSNFRLAAFLLGIGALIAAANYQSPVLAILFFLFLGAFIALIFIHAKVSAAISWNESLFDQNQRGIARCKRDWANLPEAEAPCMLTEDERALAGDLDFFGKASLFQLVNTAGTSFGQKTLCRWLFEATPADRIRERQEAVAALAPLVDERQNIAASAVDLGDSESDETFVNWTTAGGSAIPNWILWTARLSPVLLVISGLLQLFGILPLPIWPFFLALNMLIGLLRKKEVSEAFASISPKEKSIGKYANIFAKIAEMKADHPSWETHRETVSAGVDAMAELESIMAKAEIRSSLVGPVFNALALWDYHVLHRLETWRQKHGEQVVGWFEELGKAEALCSLANLKHDHPEWIFPEVGNASEITSISADALGHPLLPDGGRVCNDVTLGPKDSFLLITGSNMSGKSTLMRSLGLNAVLGQAGGPVCATRMKQPRVHLATSIRVTDSLEEGSSFFMAELQRLKAVVDQCANHPDKEVQPVYLLDEILRGTNAVERQIAVAHIVEHLVNAGAIGAVTTHDLALASLENLQDACQCVHFRETIENGPDGTEMRFDFKMREGVSPTTNALKLVEAVGLMGDGDITVKR